MAASWLGQKAAPAPASQQSGDFEAERQQLKKNDTCSHTSLKAVR